MGRAERRERPFSPRISPENPIWREFPKWNENTFGEVVGEDEKGAKKITVSLPPSPNSTCSPSLLL